MVRDRTDLFDFSAAALVAGGLTSLALFVAGLAASHGGAAPEVRREKARKVWRSMLSMRVVHAVHRRCLPFGRHYSLAEGVGLPRAWRRPALVFSSLRCYRLHPRLRWPAPHPVPPSLPCPQPGLLPVPAQLFQGSLLLGGIAKLGLSSGACMGAPGRALLRLHAVRASTHC